MIDIINLGKSFSDKKLFENVSLNFKKGNTYGIIGANGAGKSTLLKIIAKQVESTTGDIIIEKNKRISVLGQDHSIFDEIDVTTVVTMGNKDLVAIQQEKDAIYTNPDSTDKDYEKAAELEEQFGAMGG